MHTWYDIGKIIAKGRLLGTPQEEMPVPGPSEVLIGLRFVPWAGAAVGLPTRERYLQFHDSFVQEAGNAMQGGTIESLLYAVDVEQACQYTSPRLWQSLSAQQLEWIQEQRRLNHVISP